ncbi:MAG: Hpt domain-containing protein [Methylotetracoccus sp.]|jgi:HPt (histidine-containing phosphotransfer) domain-containing protein|nr:Hpt domain-containing protein [Methylotetracoccus sp.]
MEPSSPIDYRALARVLEDFGDDIPDIFTQLSELFLSDTPQLIEGLKDAAGRRDFAEARRIAHRLKGGCAQMAALTLAGDADRAETCAGQFDQSQLEQTVETMQAHWRELASELASLRDDARSGDGQAFLELIRARRSS